MKKFHRVFLSLAICFAVSVSTFSGCAQGSGDDSGNFSSVSSEQEGNNTYEPVFFTVNEGDIVSEVLGDGVVHKSIPITLKNGNLSLLHVIDVDLTKADIHAGTKDNAVMSYNFDKSTPYEMAYSWTRATGGTVFASINADFFGSYCVNAFVKDGYIIKDSHNDKGIYDYKDSDADLPASAPMLFGVKGDTAQIAPIVSYTGDITETLTKRAVVKSNLTYSASINGSVVKIQANANPKSSNATFIVRSKGSISNGLAIKVDITDGVKDLTVLETIEVTQSTSFTPKEDQYGYILVGGKFNGLSVLKNLKTGDKLSLTVSSDDNAWDGYDTILGCRQALVIDGKVAETVTLENSNGAQTTDIPRTAVGIKSSNTVCLFAVESMRYGGKGDANSTYGLNLPELGDFICWYGCKQAANFDGGGSTQLILNGGAYATPTVVVRSSDTGSTELTSTRKVMNAFLITSKIK